jgi:hypothetical protein
MVCLFTGAGFGMSLFYVLGGFTIVVLFFIGAFFTKFLSLLFSSSSSDSFLVYSSI